jgi:hypothetical protein
MRSDLSQSTHRLEEKDTLGDIHFLRLKSSDLRPKNRVLNGSHYTLMRAQTSQFRSTRSLKHKVEVPEVLPVVEYLKGDPIL